MGLIKALGNSVSTTVGDQFKEFVSIPQVESNVVIVRGEVQHGSGNKNASEGIISNGSKIIIPKNWAMMLIDNGKIEFSAEEGEYIYDNGTEPSIFSGGLGKGIIDSFKTLGTRFTFGGQTARDQRVYYINLNTVTGNLFGTSSPINVYDHFYQMSIKIMCRGAYAYRIDNPILLVNTVIGGNPQNIVTFDEVFGSQFKSEFNGQIYKAISNVMTEKKIKYSEIGNYIIDLATLMNGILSEKWGAKYGVLIEDLSIEAIEPTEEYADQIKDIESKALDARTMSHVYSDNMQGAMAAATADAMKNAASNENGAMMGFAGLNMAQGTGNSVLNTVAGMTTSKETTESVTQANLNFCPNCGTKTEGANFCGNCGTKLK